MKCILFATVFALWARNTWAQPPFGDARCDFRKNITGRLARPVSVFIANLTALRLADVQSLAHHQYTVLEDCLYYSLATKADKDQGKSQVSSSASIVLQ